MKSKRIIWVDIAKGIAIILMVMGHEIPAGNLLMRIIFSFHMPLFFVLSGFTSGAVLTFSKFWIKVRKSFIRVWLLALAVYVLYCLESFALQHVAIPIVIKQLGLGIFWGCNKPNIIIGPGTMWFMFTFFWSKLLYDFLQVKFSNKYSGIILFILMMVSFVFDHFFNFWLPQDLDLAPYGAFFMWLGWIIKKGLPIIKRRKNLYRNSLILVFVYWIGCLVSGLYVDMSVRHFPLFFVSIFEAYMGTILVSILSYHIKIEVKSLAIIGQHSLTLLCIHQLDLYWIRWQTLFSFDHWYLAVIARTVVDLSLLGIFIYIEYKVRKLILKSKLKVN